MNHLPNKKELMEATLFVLKQYHPMATQDINNMVASMLDIPNELLQLEDSNCTGTEFSYRMRWVRTELKQRNLIANPKRGFWTIISK